MSMKLLLYRRRKSGVQGVRAVCRIGCVCCGEDVNVSNVVCLGLGCSVLDGDGMGWGVSGMGRQGEAEGGKADGERRNGVGMGVGVGGKLGREGQGAR